MAARREIRADYDGDTIVVYQAYPAAIAEPALAAQRFVPPFSLTRMTWIKPSFYWLMHRSNWGRQPGQERTLGVRIDRGGWERALELGVLTTFERAVFATADAWATQFRDAVVHVQWDPERDLRGTARNHDSIQVGLGRAIIGEFVSSWVTSIEDLTPRVAKMRAHLRAGDADRARRLAPPERVYPVSSAIARRLMIDG
ncbi:MAG: DUF4291 domain-containing protein [Kofleriaceae bacterium]